MIGVHADARVSLVGDVRCSPAVTVESAESLWDAWQLMFVSGLRQLAVIGDAGTVVGILSDRSILTDLPLTEAHLSGRKVGDVMSKPGSVTTHTSMYDAADVMARHAVDAVPVVGEDGRLRALLTATDMVAWLAHS